MFDVVDAIIDETIADETIVTEQIVTNATGRRDAAAAIRREGYLRSGQAWEERGMIESAIDSYVLLVRLYRGSDESIVALERLTSIGRAFQARGYVDEALCLLDKVERLA